MPSFMNLVSSVASSPLLRGGPLGDVFNQPGLIVGTPGAIGDLLGSLPGLQGPGGAAQLISDLIGPGSQGPVGTPTPVLGGGIGGNLGDVFNNLPGIGSGNLGDLFKTLPAIGGSIGDALHPLFPQGRQ